jgi:hypothetical protein
VLSTVPWVTRARVQRVLGFTRQSQMGAKMIALDAHTFRNLRYAGARFELGAVTAAEAIRIVESLMETVVWRDEFLDVLDCQPIIREVSAPFEEWLRALDVQSESTAEAIWFLIDHHTYEITAERANPSDALFQLFDVDMAKREYDCLPDGSNTQTLLALHKEGDYFLYPCDDDWPSPESRVSALAKHETLIIEAAQRWQAATKVR